MSKVTLQQAATMAGKTKQAIRKAISAGKLTSEKDEQGRIIVQAGDVERIWSCKPVSGEKLAEVGVSTTNQDIQVTSGLQVEVEILRARIVEKDDRIQELQEERNNWQTAFIEQQKLTANSQRLLEDHRAKEKPPAAQTGFAAYVGGIVKAIAGKAS